MKIPYLVKLVLDLFVAGLFLLGLVSSCSTARAAAPTFDLVLGFYSSATGHRLDAPSYDLILHIPEPTDAVCEFAKAGARISGGKQARKTSDLSVELVDAACVKVNL